MYFAIERQHNVDKMRFIFDAPNQSYSCGRGKENMIICLSLLVSRRHCLFVRDSGDLYITDLGSSNGIYVNRVLQNSHQMVKLYENDIIGLGCANIDPKDNTFYTYKVCVIESSLDKKVEILVKEIGALPSTILNGNTSPRTPTSSAECTLGKKRFNSDNIKVPNKKFKNTDKNAHSPKATLSEEIVSCINKSLASSSTTNNSVETESHIMDMEIEDDIEIIHTSLVQDKKNQNIKDHKSATYLDNNKLNFNAKMDIIIDGNNKEESDNTNRTINKIDIKENISSNIDTTNDALNPSKNSNFICSENQIIIVEDEQTEDDEEASIDVNMTRDASLIKLKKIKYEPKTRFSEIDVIDLSDDEEEVFPCSQLFDIKYEENTENDSEIKRQYINNDDQNIEKIDLDIDDEVIFLTDSEDEDNPWLERLSRSQLLNEDKKFDPNIIVKNEIDLGIWQENDVLNRNTDNFKKSENSNNNLLMTETEPMDINDVDSSNKSTLKNIDDTNINIDDNSKKSENNNKNNNNNNLLTTETKEMDINDVGPSNKSNLKNIDDINTNIDDNSKKSENNNNNNNNNNLLIMETKVMDINDVEPSNKSTLKITSDTNKRKTNIVLSTELDKQIEGMKQKSVVRKSVTTLKRLIPIIEPLNLPARRNRVNCKDKAQKDTEKSPSKLRKKKKILELEGKVNDNFYIKKQKHHEKPSTSTADCHSSNETKAISKDQKKMIIEKRKIKLKEIAEEKKKLSIKNDKNIKRRTAKAIAKVSLKNRGDFLINEQEPSTSKSFVEKSVNLPKSNNQGKERLTDIANMLKTSSISKTQKSYQKNVSKNTVNDIATSLKQSLQLNNTNAIQVSKNSKKDSKVIDSKKSKEKKGSSNKKIRKSNESVKISERDRLTEHDPTVQKENLSSNIVKSNFKSKKKKKVTFLEKSEIREYEIDQCNSLKKLVGKDAPIPPNKLRTPPTSAEWSPKLEEFLFYIFKWNPVWLEEQRYLKGDPPIVPQSELQTMKLSYDSYKQYYKIVMPLLLLEIWCAMTKEFEMIEKNKQRATMMCSVVENPTCTPIPSTNLFLTTLKLEVLVKKEDLNKVHPIYGDLVCIEYITNTYKKQNVNRIFAYVTNMQQMIITNFTLYNQELIKYVKNPYAILTYTLLTRPLQHDFPVNRVQRIRTVMYLRANIRMVQALQYLPQSPISNLILNPKIEEYQLPPMDEQFTCSSLVTRDNLNPKQMEAVYKVTKTVLKKENKLCFIQGPPGTGKSKVIVNLVSQILYSEHTNRKTLRILICAPSNAAIDEIVLRLLNVRSKLKKNRFNMVRIGRMESMHLMAKPISVTELGKRHLTKISQEAVYSDNTEELAILEAKINSLKAELSSLQQKDEDKKKEIRRRLMETLMRYELVKCGKPINEFSSKDRTKYQRMAENIILTGADIIACTLSSCYTNQMESIFGGYKERISVCIVDEATQSCEAETLIPLMLGVKTLVLVGDPNQLPATVLSQRAKKLKLDQSVFSRIQNVFTSQQNNPIIMLNMQYRMDYAISYWPNKYFYDGKLKNSIDFRMKFPFHSYRILDHNFKQNEDKFSNTIEAEFIAKTILAMLTFTNWENVNPISLGVLTPYNNQRTLVLNKINEKISSIPDNLRNKISFEVNTVDSFQGQERDIIIMSCVRSHGIGFLSDRQRLCVALTRAKYSLILCGNFNTFLKDKMWNALLSDAKSRGVLCRVDAHAAPVFIRQFIIK
ncbi:helicase sen1 isoform X2 [Camponotus floridanus]|uniref:helicase sen1 isoform X2 n=1 Tax=Camponotus floridanus TaxID=104421 RepID=UPI000DC6AB5B|nr:helicase sen1 isoform X2 [Camponotus floridanus]